MVCLRLVPTLLATSLGTEELALGTLLLNNCPSIFLCVCFDKKKKKKEEEEGNAAIAISSSRPHP